MYSTIKTGAGTTSGSTVLQGTPKIRVLVGGELAYARSLASQSVTALKCACMACQQCGPSVSGGCAAVE